MKRLILILALLPALCTWSASAQDNGYGIDNTCYHYFLQAELSIADFETDSFDKNLSALLTESLAKGDKKAQTIYYVLLMRRITNRARMAPDSDRAYWNEQVLQSHKTTQEIAKSTGYIQYYYYATELLLTYLFNTGQNNTAQEFLMKMNNEAKEAGDEYGIWSVANYLAKLYLRQSDDLNARPYLQEAIRMHETTTDPTIRRQNISALYSNLARTYPPGSDSCRIAVRNALAIRQTMVDTLRCYVDVAMLASLDDDKESFDTIYNQCMENKAAIASISVGSPAYLECTKAILHSENIDTVKTLIKKLDGHYSKWCIATLAYTRKQWDLAAYAWEVYADQVFSDLSRIGNERLGEMSALYENNRLSADLANASQKVTRTTMILSILLTVLLLGALLFTWLHMRTLKKANDRDEQRIAELQEANEKVRLADAAKTRFVQNMSHEVRTPLNAIVGFSQLLSLPDGSFPEEEKEEFASHIVNNTKMLTMLLDDILNASAMDSGGYRITYEDGEMHFMAQAAISSAEHRLQPGVRLYYAPESEEPFTFRTDPRRVQQILINLLTNACKHTTEGEIKVSSSLSATPGFVTYAVTDTGTGVPADKAELIFERFAKLNDFVQGTGLGLSICREIATKMGAKVYLDTTHPGPGARFVFEVPVNPNEPSPIIKQ